MSGAKAGNACTQRCVVRHCWRWPLSQAGALSWGHVFCGTSKQGQPRQSNQGKPRTRINEGQIPPGSFKGGKAKFRPGTQPRGGWCRCRAAACVLRPLISGAGLLVARMNNTANAAQLPSRLLVTAGAGQFRGSVLVIGGLGFTCHTGMHRLPFCAGDTYEYQALI